VASRTSIAAGLVLSLPGAALADSANLRTRGSLWTLAAADIRWEDGPEDHIEQLSYLSMEARWNTPGGGRVLMGVAGEHWLAAGPETRSRVAMWPDKLRWDRPLASWAHLRLGQQVARWGQLEATSVVDLLNPADLRHGPLLPADDARIPVPMARLELGPPVLRVQLYMVPWHVPDRFHLVGSDWAMFPTGLVEEMVGSAADWGGDPTTQAVMGELAGAMEKRIAAAEPSVWWGFDQSLQTSGEVWEPLSELEAAARLTWAGAGADAALQAGYVRSDAPTIKVDRTLMSWVGYQLWPTMEELETFMRGTSPIVELDYPYTMMAGADFAVTLGSFGLRAETAWRSNQGLTTATLVDSSSPELGLALGAEYSGSSSVQFGVEASWRRLTDVHSNLLARREDEGLAASYLKLTLARERLRPELVLLWSPTFSEGLGSAAVEFKPEDSWALSLHTWIFFAPTGTPRTLESLVEYDGGPLGLYNDNDSWAMRFTWYL